MTDIIKQRKCKQNDIKNNILEHFVHAQLLIAFSQFLKNLQLFRQYKVACSIIFYDFCFKHRSILRLVLFVTVKQTVMIQTPIPSLDEFVYGAMFDRTFSKYRCISLISAPPPPKKRFSRNRNIDNQGYTYILII